MKYTFGTSEAATLRLEQIAELLNPMSKTFIRKYVIESVGSAIDLGCGPGFTTNMLYEATGCSNVYGIDSASNFLKIAAETFKHCTFINHDVTKTPLPVHADVMYARFLLSHLLDVVELVKRWVEELPNKGKLIIEELEDIETDNPVFQRYLAINIGLVASQGAVLYVGKTVADGVYDADVLCKECISIPVTNYQAATWFYPNTVTIWEQEQYVLDNINAKVRKELSDELLRIKQSHDTMEAGTWKLRRLVLQRR